jgi:transposase
MTIGVDLAKNVFALAIAVRPGAALQRRRLTRPQFERFLHMEAPAHLVMEACGSAHHWARVAQAAGHRVSLLPPQRVRPYVVAHRKTDGTDAAGLLEAIRNPTLHPVAPKTLAQQELMALHRIRQQWMRSRTARLNALRGTLQEFGIPMAQGPKAAYRTARGLLADERTAVPPILRTALAALLDEIRDLEDRVARLEHQLAALATTDSVVARLQSIPGIGLLTATACVGTVGHIHGFPTARHFASWTGLTPREHSSGQRRRLGHISKAGDCYLRMLLTHGARSALVAARRRERSGRALVAWQRWALQVAARAGHNKATIALANKLARIIWVVWTREVEFTPAPPVRRAA